MGYIILETKNEKEEEKTGEGDAMEKVRRLMNEIQLEDSLLSRHDKRSGEKLSFSVFCMVTSFINISRVYTKYGSSVRCDVIVTGSLKKEIEN